MSDVPKRLKAKINLYFVAHDSVILLPLFSIYRCGHSKKMKPDWDKLMSEFEESKTQLVAEVDCTSKRGKPLCDDYGIKGYPTLKWGDPMSLQDYSGLRDLDSFRTFVKDKLKPICSPTHMELCDKSHQKDIKSYKKLGIDKLQKEINKKEKEIDTIEVEYNKQVEELQKQFKKLKQNKEEKILKVKDDGGLSLMQKVLISLKKAQHDEL